MNESLPIGDEELGSMDDLFQIAVDQEKIAEFKRDSQMPPGTYLRDVDTPATVTRNTHPYTGRQGLSVFAIVTNGKEKGGVRFNMSWVRVNKIIRNPETGEETDTGRPDHQNQLYTQMIETYKKAHDSEFPKSMGELAQFIQSAPYRVRLGKGTDREVVFAISPPSK